jgi:hypothetical protein
MPEQTTPPAPGEITKIGWITTRFEVAVDGYCRVAEYKANESSVVELLDLPRSDEIDFEVGYSESVDEVEGEDIDKCVIDLRAYHQKNPETARVYNLHLSARLGWAQVRQLHAYLGFLVEQVAEPKHTPEVRRAKPT